MKPFSGVKLTIITDEEPIDFVFKTVKISTWCKELKTRLRQACEGLKVDIKIRRWADCQIWVNDSSRQEEVENILEKINFQLYSELTGRNYI